MKRIGDFSLTWGESLCWDDQKNRLYFVDCWNKKLHWLNNAEPPLFSMDVPSVPTGMGLVEDGRLLISLDNGLNLVDPENSETELLTTYPNALGRRANDGVVDPSGNFITGSLKEPSAGSYWRYSRRDGWEKLDDGISNANGPVVLKKNGLLTLVFADTPAKIIYAYDYDSHLGTVDNKRIFANTATLNGSPDGACATKDGSILSCLIKPGLIAQYSEDGLIQTFAAGSEQPSDVTFGGSNLDRLFVVSISVEFGHGQPQSPLAGALVEIENTGLVGVPENRFIL
jgi:sugar lactone lactonase YvrE